MMGRRVAGVGVAAPSSFLDLKEAVVGGRVMEWKPRHPPPKTPKARIKG